ncbi:hypothetical protein ABIF96_008329 [Bradyrhizobium ottawaense]
MQEDQLLSGSIADNICFFDTTFDLQGMIDCARIAGIHEDIMAMPMSYNSLIGDMGSSLSSGQKQRVLLARALYRRPKILFLDEGTAHLDTEKEKEINANLRQLNMTRVSVAHRPEITQGADMIIHLGAAAEPFRVGMASGRPAVAPERDVGVTGFAAEGAKSTETAHDHGACPGDATGDCAKRDPASKDAKDACDPHKDYCQPRKDCNFKPSDDCGKADNPGEALAKIDFSRC